MLDRVIERSIEFVEGRDHRVILSADHWPVKTDGGQIVGDARRCGYIRFNRGAQLAGDIVDRLGPGSIRCFVENTF